MEVIKADGRDFCIAAEICRVKTLCSDRAPTLKITFRITSVGVTSGQPWLVSHNDLPAIVFLGRYLAMRLTRGQNGFKHLLIF